MNKRKLFLKKKKPFLRSFALYGREACVTTREKLAGQNDLWLYENRVEETKSV